MWGQIHVDYHLHKNFNVGFASHKNDIHVYLSQWQYWWWFWFSVVWALYFFIIIKCVVSKTSNFNFIQNTSLRSHGKWGDFLIAIIPLSWCGNILINSNFILRMIEWQNESSLFTIRIQGKQWYWAYKYNSDTDYRLKNMYINVGNNNWLKTNTSSKHNFATNNSTLIYSFEYEFKKLYNSILDKKEKLNKNFINSNYNNNLKLFNFTKVESANSDFNIVLNKKLFSKLKNKIYEYSNSNILYNENINNYNLINVDDKKEILSINSYKTFNIFDILSINKNSKTYWETDKLDEVEESSESLRFKNNNFPIKLIKGILNKHNISILNTETTMQKNIFLSYRTNSVNTTSKISQIEQFWGFRQKKNKKLKQSSFASNKKYHNVTYDYISNFLNNDNFKKYNLYTNIRNNKYKSELIPLNLAKRLLRTKRTLVLPAHINLTLITGSYDVVHSWFVPGLGLKIDCVPGRSTHHSLYIDNIGFYYGQCAEICGRYHHHMPIRICALNFEHFIVWWNHKGLPRMYRSKYYLENKKALINKLN